MNWLHRTASTSDKRRINYNIVRLETLREKLHDLSYYTLSSQSGTYQILEQLLKEKIVLGRPKVEAKIREALVGENNQKLILDSPMRVQGILLEAEELVKSELAKELVELQKLSEEDEISKRSSI